MGRINKDLLSLLDSSPLVGNLEPIRMEAWRFLYIKILNLYSLVTRKKEKEEEKNPVTSLLISSSVDIDFTLTHLDSPHLLT